MDRFLHWINFFDFKQVYGTLDKVKSKGHAGSGLMKVLMMVTFAGKDSLHAFMCSSYGKVSLACKDSYYRFKRRPDVDWQAFLTSFVKRFVKIVKGKGTEKEGGAPKCLVVDDSFLAKLGQLTEGVGKLWDHASMRYLLGYRLLLLGYFDGKSFLPVDFTLHREKGKNPDRPYGLKREVLDEQFGSGRGCGSITAGRKLEMDEDKISCAIKMIAKACKYLEVDYLLMDSWFTCERMLVEAERQGVKLIGMAKMAKAKYGYQGHMYSAKELLAKVRGEQKRCRKLSATYIQVSATYKGHGVKLFFSRFGSQDRWHLVLTTDLKSSYVKIMELYQVRWSIEVFFKEAKQYLRLGKSQSEDLAAQFADITISMTQYILLTLRKRFGDYETKGEVFREAEEKLMEFTLDQRLWGLFQELVRIVTEIFGIEIDDVDSFMSGVIKSDGLQKIANLYRTRAD